ncbi:GDP-mannose 4,6-dehydratase [Bariatricus massiliensis]|uniref:GDP-mannose 4,6-dehydratase n=1 Tax=Bariatricus massiliensis TaxID=1745713 RepID=A0ABS8DCX1_9FIRM|nr:NAD-dependent epimerase/dehydratase family protein [Bariatricus massiliensis]MCB7303468.1 GDP-mannose 4,6-dehydratase [Bariatricus massiliensis]MCB7373600.1 GDP-mannose 4,6-dehydratase [Bariatricus massiliensis]MCB7386270.1 GDP-mannose 4,6-dehydratase [Bariatricus massiliensis]MCB7410432.1 GDP-mannose 4,6-dehydratase [Bariatricus massiliensis]MCQ5252284.1 GDP-mannose 4,6-dehydratase [Bariatricus massiliensis]
MKKILITGGCGFIGAEIVKQLYEDKEFEVTVYDAMIEQIHGNNWRTSYLYKSIENKCDFIKGDVRDYSLLQKAIIGKDIIIHLAAETGTGQSMYRINQYNEVNIMGTSNILQAISSLGEKNNVKKVILASSRAVYGEGKYECPKCGVIYPSSRIKQKMLAGDFTMYCNVCGAKAKAVETSEDSKIQPNSLYAFTKFAQETMLQTMCPSLGIEYTIFRFQNVYGVGQSLKNPYTGILSIFSSLLLENRDINIFEDGKETRDFINVKDVAAGVVKSIFCDESNSQIINLGSGKSTSVLEIARYLKKAYKSNSKLNITGDFRIGDIANNIADVTKSEKLLGFRCCISLEEGLKDFCRWVEEEEKDTSGYEKSLTEMESTGMFVRKNK